MRIVWMTCVFLLLCYTHVNAQIPLKIIIDPGHGGIDGGTTSYDKQMLEKDFNLIFAKKLAERLRKSGYSVASTREGDYDATQYAPANGPKKRHPRDLLGRVTFASMQKGDLIVSIHANHGHETANGPIVFFKKQSLDGYMLASKVQGELNKATKTHNSPLAGNYYIVRKPDIPSILVETGYLSNPYECDQLRNPDYQNRLISAIDRAVYLYAIFNR